MLRAVLHKKTTRHRRYLGHREEGDHRVAEEDEITSTFFDGLALLDARDSLRFWSQLLDHAQRSSFLPEGEPVDVDWRFWPKRWSDGASIEPDMHLEFRWPGGARRSFLVELKWQSKIGEQQLQKQWTNYLTDQERTDSLHIFIGKDVAPALAAKAELDVWGSNQLVLRPWIEIRSAMNLIGHQSGPLRRWIALADQFLEKLQVSFFCGIPWPTEKFALPRPEAPIFWGGLTFDWSAPAFSGCGEEHLATFSAPPYHFLRNV